MAKSYCACIFALYECLFMLLPFLFIQGLAFLQVVSKIWSDRSFTDGTFKEQFNWECQKWLQLLLQLIDITDSKAETHLHLFLKGGGAIAVHQKVINETVSAIWDNFYS